MKLNIICWKLAAKVLGKPGTMVERMSNFDGDFVKDGIYKVLSRDCDRLKLEGLNGYYFAECFRKREVVPLL